MDNPKHQEWRLLYQDALDEIRSAKRLQVQVTYYALLLYAGLIYLQGQLEHDRSCEVWSAYPWLVLLAVAFVVIGQVCWWICRCRRKEEVVPEALPRPCTRGASLIGTVIVGVIISLTNRLSGMGWEPSILVGIGAALASGSAHFLLGLQCHILGNRKRLAYLRNLFSYEFRAAWDEYPKKDHATFPHATDLLWLMLMVAVSGFIALWWIVLWSH